MKTSLRDERIYKKLLELARSRKVKVFTTGHLGDIKGIFMSTKTKKLLG